MKAHKLLLLLLFLIRFLALSAHAIVDEDLDGMSDLWERQNGFSPFDDGTLTPSQAPSADPDGDGQSNLLESIAGTNPNSASGPLSSFRTTVTTHPAQAGSFNLDFPQLIGKQYQLQSSTDLRTWLDIGNSLIGTSIPVTLTTPVPSAATPKTFFRISVKDTDFDFDSLSSYEESQICSNPNNPDSDGDGVGDKTEYENGSNPCYSADDGVPPPITPAQLPPAELIKIRLYTSVQQGDTYSQISPSGDFLTPYDVNVYKKHKTTGIETLVYTMNYSGFNPSASRDISLPNLPDFVYTIQATIPDLSSSTLVSQYRDFKFIVNAVQLAGSAPFTIKARFNPTVSPPLGAFGNLGFNLGFPANPHTTGIGAYRLVLSTLDIDEVISDQIAGNDANKLPTPAYGKQPNNPMVMATRTGNDARLRVKMNAFAPLASQLLIAVREVTSGTIKGSTVPLLNLASTPVTYNAAVSFTAANGSLLHEVVVGQDTNSNGTLEASEVKSTFEKTPRLDVGGGTYSGKDTLFKFLDKIIVVTGPDFVQARSATETYGNIIGNQVTYPNFSALINAFSVGSTTIPGTTTDYGIPISAGPLGSSSPSGLSLPLGARWDAANQALLHRIVYPNGSSLSDEIKVSNAIQFLYGRIITANQLAIAAAALPGYSTYTINGILDKKTNFNKTDAINDVRFALGKSDFTGSLQVSMRATSDGFEVAQVNCSGTFDDLYDYKWP